MSTSFNSALLTADYNSLRGTGSIPSYAGSQYASQCPNSVVFAAQFNSAQDGSVGSFAQEEFHNVTVGSYTDVKPGMWFLASKTNDMTQAYFVGRARKAFGSSTAFFNETSIAQAGDDFFWCLNSYPIMDKLLRFLLGQNEYLVDYDISYRPLLPIIGSANDAIGCKSAYAGFVDPANDNEFRISLSILIYPSESAATITSWSLNYLDGELISGSASGSGTTTGTITLDFPAGFRNILFTATNSAGVSSTLAIAVWAETRSGSPTLITGFNGATITQDVSAPSSKQTCSIEVFSAELQNTLPNTLICVWDEEILNGTLGSVGGNVRFLGRLRKEQNVAAPDEKYLRTLVTKYSLEGPDTQLERLLVTKLGMKDNTSPTQWGDIKSMTPYRNVALLLTEFTTFLNSNVMNFDNYDDTFPYPALSPVGSTKLGEINDIGMSLNAQMQFAPDGRASFVRHAFFLSNAQRNALTTVANWTDQDRTPGLNITLDEIRNVAQVDAWGGEDIGTQQVVPQHSQAPGLAPDIGDKSQIQLLKQILSNVDVTASQLELNDRAGCQWFLQALQRRLDNLTQPPGYGFLIPDTAAWYTWTISASDNLRGISFNASTRWILEKLTTTHDNRSGTKTVTPTYLQETNGLNEGNTIPIITSNNLPVEQQNLALQVYPLLTPVVPPIEMPGPDSAVLKTGITKLALILSDGTITYTTNFNQTPPTWSTPVSLGVSGTVLRWVPDFLSGYYAGGGAGTKSYGWIVTTTGVYYGDINTPSFTLGHTFRATSSLRSASASLIQAGHIVIVTDYSDGTYVTYATTGANWVSEASLGAGAGNLPPGCWYSQHVSGQVFSSVVGAGKKSTDGGATWSNYTALNPSGDAAVDITAPFPSNATDDLLYYVQNSAPVSVTSTVTFDPGGYSNYTVTPNTFNPQPAISGGGNPGNCLSGGITTVQNACNPADGVESEATIIVTIPANSTVTLASMDGLLTNPHSFNLLNMSITLRDNAGGTLASYGGTQTVTPGTWHNLSSGAIGVAGVYTVAFNVNVCDGTFIDLTAFMDNCLITYHAVGTTIPKLMKLSGGSSADISPLPTYGPYRSQQIDTALHSNSIIGVGAGLADLSLVGIFVSQDQGSTWSTLVAPVADGTTGRYTWLPMSGDSFPVLYPAGTKGKIGYSASLGGTVIDKRGNLSTSVGEVIGLAGYRS